MFTHKDCIGSTVKSKWLVALALGVTGCGSVSNPKTAGLDSLNPPGHLVSITQDGALELRWTAANAEDDFGGYYVFATKKSLSTLQALVKYPEGAAHNLGEAGIPRCEDNSPFYETFGLAAADNDCEGGASTSSASGSSLVGNSQLAADAEETVTGFVQCSGNDDATISLKKASPNLGTTTCSITKAWDPATKALVAIENGTTYSVFVVSVEDDRKTISWTSNVVEDTPSRTALSSSTAISVGADKFVVISIGESDFSGTSTLSVSSQQSCSTSAHDTSPCALRGTNGGATASGTVSTSGIYLARDAQSSSFPQRLFISTHSSSEVQLLPRGPQTFEASDGTSGNVRVSEDHAIGTAAAYPDAGTKYAVYNNQVFDILFSSGSKKYFGKIIVGDVTYASDSKEGAATLAVTVVLQPQAESIHYLR